jgi:hypothetical protein
MRQPPQTYAAAALFGLGVRMAVTLVAALAIWRLSGLSHKPFLVLVAVAQCYMLGADTAVLVRLTRRKRGER